jgi:hypothetical protein
MEINDIINGLNCSDNRDSSCSSDRSDRSSSSSSSSCSSGNIFGNNLGGIGAGFGGSWIWIILILLFFCCGNRGNSPFGGVMGNNDYNSCMYKCMEEKAKHKNECDCCCNCVQNNHTNGLFGGSWWLFLLVLLFICSGSGSCLGGSDILSGGCGC